MNSEVYEESDTKQFRHLLDHSLEGVVQIDREDRILYTSTRFAEMLGYTASEMAGQCIFDFLYPEDLSRMRAARAACRSGDAASYELRMQHRNGTECWHSARVSLIFEDDTYAGTLSLHSDITARKDAEENLRRSEAKLAEAQRVAKVGSWELDAKTFKVSWSAEMFYLAGLNPCHGVPDYPGNLALYCPEDAAKLDTLIQRAIEQGWEYAMDIRRVPPKGAVQWFQAGGYAVKDEDGQTVRLVGTLLDITARKNAEESLRRREADLQLALGAAHLGTLSCEWPFGRVTLNPTGREHLGLLPDTDTTFLRLYSQLHPDDRAFARAAFARAIETQTEYNAEYRVLTEGGGVRWINVVGRGRYDPCGVPLRFDGVTIDITERKQAEEALAEVAAHESCLRSICAAIRLVSTADAVREAATQALGEALNADRCYLVSYDLEQMKATIGPDWHRSGLTSVAGQYPIYGFSGNQDPSYLVGGTQALTDTRRLSPTGADPCLDLRALLRVPLSPAPHHCVLAAVMTKDCRHWTPGEIKLTETVAGELKTALETISAQETQQHIVSAWERFLQPPLLRHLPGLSVGAVLRPALKEAALGGDFCDIFPLDAEHYALVLGDISGKGLPAAAQAATVRPMLRYSLYQSSGVLDAVRHLNAVLTGQGFLAGFVTLFVGVYSPQTGEIVCVICGQEPALHSAATGLVTIVESTGPPLGVDAGAAYSETRLTLAPSDRLLVHTDGLAEAGQDHRSMLGTPGMIALLQASVSISNTQAAAEQIVQAAEAYAGHPFVDDISALLLRRG